MTTTIYHPELTRTKLSWHSTTQDQITGAIHTNLTSVLVCGGENTFDSATVESGGVSGFGSYANQCSSKISSACYETAD